MSASVYDFINCAEDNVLANMTMYIHSISGLYHRPEIASP